MFDRLFRKKPALMPNLSISYDPDSLLKKATAMKSDGDIEGAIKHLRAAYKEIGKTSISYSVKTFLRLPQYLQIAGRRDEAWQEFNNLLACGFPNQIKNRGIVPMDQSIIYDKMRLFLQREGRHDAALKFGVFSYLCWMKGLFYQKRKKELRDFEDKLSIQGHVNYLLKKVKNADVSEKITEIIWEEIRNLPNIDLGEVGRRVSKIMEWCK